jgi:iron complex outermembrane receptor protein
MKIRLLALSLLTSSLSFADEIKQLAPTVVTATRVETNSFDLPISIDVVEDKDIHNGNLAMSVAESLVRIPGITANDRSEMTQDTQITTRGFGARSAFGVRGIRLYIDGISLSSSDGISFPGSINLDNIKSIEVMRGPFSSLYGSSSGGVVQFLTADAPKNTEIKTSFMAGSFGTTKESIGIAGTEGDIQYNLNTTAFNSSGYRDHSASHENESNAHLKINLQNDTRIILLANHMDLHAQDPLGNIGTATKTTGPVPGHLDYITNTEYSIFTDPSKSPSVASLDNTSVHKENTQIGITIQHDINQNNTINFINYTGHRINSQILSTSTSYLNSRDSVYTRDYFGNEINWINNGDIFNHNYTLTTGLVYGSTRDNREDLNGYAGVTGGDKQLPSAAVTIKRNEIDNASNLDEYLQGKLAINKDIDFHFGARNTNVNYNVKNFVTPSSSGGLHFSDTTSVLGAIWKVSPSANLYGNYGRGFETPTLTEIVYGTGGTGSNYTLKPSTSDNYEIGAKAFIFNNTKVNLALFRTNTSNEIVITQATATYTVYGNSATTSRQGIEASIDSPLKNNFNLYGAYTYLDAQFDKQYQNGSNSYVNAGNRIPGTYRNQLYGEISWKYPEYNFTSALEARYMSKTFVNDVNSQFAPSYTVLNLRTGFQQIFNKWKFSEYFKINNLLDENYVAAVRINDFNSRFYEAAPTRNYLLGLSATYGF